MHRVRRILGDTPATLLVPVVRSRVFLCRACRGNFHDPAPATIATCTCGTPTRGRPSPRSRTRRSPSTPRRSPRRGTRSGQASPSRPSCGSSARREPFSPRRLCSRGRRGGDGKLVILDLATGKRLYEWTFNEQLGGVAITTDGRHVAVGLATGVIYVLRIDPAKKPG